MFILNLLRKDFFNKKERYLYYNCMEFVFICYIFSSVVIFVDLFLFVFEGCVGVYNRGVNCVRIYV